MDVEKIKIGSADPDAVLFASATDENAPYTVECWDAYVGDAHVYHKDKTLANCLEKYGYAYDASVGEERHESAIEITYPVGTTDGEVVLPPIADLADHILADKFIAWRIHPKNTEIWDVLKAAYDGKTYSPAQASNVWARSGVCGELTMRISNPTGRSTGYGFLETGVTKAQIVSDDPIKGYNLFYGAGSLLDASVTDTSGNVKAVVGSCFNMFKDCTSIVNIGDTIQWDGITYMEGMFGGCTALSSVASVIDMSLVHPQETGDGIHDGMGGWDAFDGCAALSSLKLSGLNHGDWFLDGTGDGYNNHGDLSALDKESVEYLLDHLTSLTAHDANRCLSTWKNDFVNHWTVNNKSVAAVTGYGTLSLVCKPQEVLDSYGDITKETLVAYTEVSDKGEVCLDFSIEMNNKVKIHLIQIDSQNTVTELGFLEYENSVITLPVDGSSGIIILGFYVSNTGDSTLSGTLMLEPSYEPSNPYVPSATLHLPAELKDFADSGRLKEAASKGWTVEWG